MLTGSDETVIVTTPDLAGLRDGKNLVDGQVSARGQDAVPHLVLNHVGAFGKGELSLKDFTEALGRKPAITMPHDPSLFLTAFNNGQMLGEISGGKAGKIAESLRQLAVKLAGRQPVGRKTAARNRVPFASFFKKKTA